MLSAFFDPLYESVVDMTQNQVSLLVIILLCVIVALLIAASLSTTWRNILVRARFLEKDESPHSLLIWVIGIVFIVKVLQAFIIQPFIVDGGSMLPTFHNREFLLVDKLSYHLHLPSRGDVVIFKLLENNASPYTGRYLIKRVIGLPGEHVVIKNAVTTIYNKAHPEGFVVPETFVTSKDPNKNIDIILASDEFFVMGDNRAESYDSRSWGPLKEAHLRGKVLVRVLPLGVFGISPGSYSFDK